MIGDESDAVYFKRRAAAEAATARASKTALIREIHQELASLYETRAAASIAPVVSTAITL